MTQILSFMAHPDAAVERRSPASAAAGRRRRCEFLRGPGGGRWWEGHVVDRQATAGECQVRSEGLAVAENITLLLQSLQLCLELLASRVARRELRKESHVDSEVGRGLDVG